MKEYYLIANAYEDLKNLKEKYRYWQHNTELLKSEIYDPYDTELDKWDWEMSIQYRIDSNKYILRNLEKEIRELRNIIKEMNRKQNEARKNKHIEG